MEIAELIEQLSSKLDPEKDSLLLFMLDETLNRNADEYLNKYSITDRDYRYAKDGLRMSLEFFLRNKRLERLEKVANGGDCIDCKIDGKGLKHQEEICKRCTMFYRYVNNELYKIKDQNTETSKTLLNNPELEMIIKCKAICNKLTKKIRIYATSKH